MSPIKSPIPNLYVACQNYSFICYHSIVIEQFYVPVNSTLSGPHPIILLVVLYVFSCFCVFKLWSIVIVRVCSKQNEKLMSQKCLFPPLSFGFLQDYSYGLQWVSEIPKMHIITSKGVDTCAQEIEKCRGRWQVHLYGETQPLYDSNKIC